LNELIRRRVNRSEMLSGGDFCRSISHDHAQLATNNVGNAQSRVATLGKLVGISTRLNHFEPLKWSIIKKER
jgi:hypothetical protein